MSRRIRVGVLMGGASSEREISLASGKMVAQHLPKERYDVVMLDTLALMAGNRQLSEEQREQARALLAGGGRKGALLERDRALPAAFQDEIQQASQATLPATEAILPRSEGARIDVAFLALHGKYGEDGTLQGMLDILGIPYVGSGTLASALAMDKAMTKKVLEAEGIPVPRGVIVERDEFLKAPDATAAAAARALPAVVKPVRQGSSIGMSMVADAASMRRALEEALSFDPRALVEERLVGTELTVGVIGNRELQALPVVEIVSKRDFFDYRAKYDPALSDEICPARIPADAAARAQQLAQATHRALGCRGLSRTDQILVPGRGPVVLELNTMPGMTINSLLPKAAKAAGIPFAELLDRLVQLALEEG